jgi:hypothetical protein
VLLVRDAGILVTKDRFLGEVWSGVPVTDEALTQCIKALRRALGDDAARPRFIETVPKHGYRFVAPLDGSAEAVPSIATRDWHDTLLLGSAGTIGGGIAGLVGGIVYGFVGASDPLQPGLGAVSVLLVIMCLSIAVALIGAAGVSFGIAFADHRAKGDWRWRMAGGALGGLFVGAIVKLLGVDAFNLLFGRSPAGMTGAMEGLLIGAGTGAGSWLALHFGSRLRKGMLLAAIPGAAAGIVAPLLGGRLMAGSLDLLSHTFANSRLRLDRIGGLFGEQHFGPISAIATGTLEGALFSACVVGAMIVARRNLDSVSRENRSR